MLEKNVEKECMSWTEFQALADFIVDQVKVSGCKFNYIVGIPRGGLPLAVYLSHHLGLPLKAFGQIEADKGAKILLVDDISDTGACLIETLPRLENNEVKVATLLWRVGTKVIPDFSGKFLNVLMDSEEYKWIIFPWECK